MTQSTNMSTQIADPIATRNALLAKSAKPAAKTTPAQAPATPSALDMKAVEALMAQNAAIMAQFQALQAENAALKAGKAAPAPKPERPPVTCQNCTYTYDAKQGTVTIVVDLNANIMDEATGAPRVSKTGVTTAVAQLFGKLADKTGRMVGFSLNAYYKPGK